MAVVATRITVGTTAVLLNPQGDTDSISGSSVLVRNRATVAIDVGGAAVTSGAGFEVLPNEAIPFDLQPGELLYGIAGTAGNRVDSLQSGV